MALDKTYGVIRASAGRLLSSIVSVLKIIVQAKRIEQLPPGIKQNCAILGNGPSLSDSLENNLDFIKNECDILCVNNFLQSEYFRILKPGNYILLDGYYFIFDSKKYNRPDVAGTFERFKTIDWPINMYLPVYARNSYLVNTVLKNNTCIKVYYFNHIVVEGYNWFKFPIFKRGLGMPQCQNILGASLFVSINRMYKNIYLFGADHSWHENFVVSDTNIMMMSDGHFYDKDAKINSAYSPRTDMNVTSFFLALYKTFRSYSILNEYAKYRSVKVYNASAKTYIDAFEKIKL